MIKVYKKNGIPEDTEYIKYNDAFFNKYTAALIDGRAGSVIEHIDESELLDKYHIASRFDGTKLNIDRLSQDDICELYSGRNGDMIIFKRKKLFG